ncbi:MAG TPA: tetraacyldisaccharide 4'-kinase [Steroidobacteraceae bacterium]|nr:tetraacyldisaccharide 4'-kinase [Steroidobacteraceae bacterium]
MPAREAAQRWLQNIWYGQARAPWSLRTLSALYGGAMRLRAGAYRRQLLSQRGGGCPLIVVGNLTVGGSGKTPLVIWTCEQLRALGLSPGIILRGYGGSLAQRGGVHLVDARSDPRLLGDEAVLLAQRTGLPVVVGRDRVAAARQLARAPIDVIVADDGLQHLRLARDLELVVIDAARGLGNGRLLPAGPLRESAARLAEVQALILNGEPAHAAPLPATKAVPRFHMRLVGERLFALDASGRQLELASLRGRAVHAVAGIGDPARFFRQLRAAGLTPTEHAFPDHHAYRREELSFADGVPLLMTEKDAVKCRPLGLHDAWYLPVSASFPPAEAGALRELLQAAVRRVASLTQA